VTIVILLVLVGLLWVAVLAPSAWRKFGERQGVGSIDHFHHQLQLLEHAGPKTVSPAYRLHTALPTSAGTAAETPLLAADSSRPKLVLLRPTDDAVTADVEDHEGLHYERIGVLDRPEPACPPEVGEDLRALRRDEARRRFTLFLRCLGGVALSTFIIGIFPGMHLAWVFTALTGLPALALVGLVAYAREVEAQQRIHRRGQRPVAVHRDDAFAEPDEASFDPATAGYPGAWDDDVGEVPRAVAAR
jgi:hypothetical protein